MKIINLYVKSGTLEAPIATPLASGTKQQLEALGFKYKGKAWSWGGLDIPESVKLLPGEEIVAESLNMASQQVMLNLPTFMIEYLQEVSKSNNGATFSSIMQSMILDQIDREELAANSTATESV